MTKPIPSLFENWLRPAHSLVAVCLLLASLEGCTSMHAVQVNREGRPVFESLELQCQFRRELNQEAILPSQSPIEQTSGSEGLLAEEKFLDGHSKMPDWNRGVVEILCPAPDGTPNEALIRMRYWKEDEPLMQAVRTRNSRGDSSFRSRVKQVVFHPENSDDWLGGEVPKDPSRFYTREAKVPRHKIDFLLADLAKSGFYEQQHRPVGATWMSLKIDEGQVEKRWDLEPRLLELINETLSSQSAYDSERIQFVPAPKKPEIVTTSGEEESKEPHPEFLTPEEAAELAAERTEKSTSEESENAPSETEEELFLEFQADLIFAN